MTEYKLTVHDYSDPSSRLVFLKEIEEFLNEQKKAGTIKSYSLATPYKSINLFKMEPDKI